MQNFTQIIGMPVISIFNCELIGTVINMQISKDNKHIKYLIISSTDEETTYLLSPKNVYAVNSVVLIRNKQHLSVTNELMQSNLINTSAFGLSGKSYGAVKEINLNDNWQITQIITEQTLPNAQLLHFTQSLSIFNDTDKKYSKSTFAPKLTEPQQIPTPTTQIVTALAEPLEPTQPTQNTILQNNVSTPRTIIAKLPKNFRVPNIVGEVTIKK
ncbi:MAG: PRC-barrel domain-containing protein [Clostridia bacterium]|nr:PRC-barrel domain-containing protein [Clostridia bacterium]